MEKASRIKKSSFQKLLVDRRRNFLVIVRYVFTVARAIDKPEAIFQQSVAATYDHICLRKLFVLGAFGHEYLEMVLPQGDPWARSRLGDNRLGC